MTGQIDYFSYETRTKHVDELIRRSLATLRGHLVDFRSGSCPWKESFFQSFPKYISFVSFVVICTIDIRASMPQCELVTRR